MIRVRGLQKSYETRQGRVEAVRSIDLDVAEHEFCVLLGPSACGKTTTLRCVAGLETPDGGEIELDGEVVYSAQKGVFVPPERRDIGMVFQSYAVWPHMTVHQVVAYPLTDGRKRVKRDEVQGRVRAALDLVQLGGLESRPVTDLSGGQQQRVALARALVAEPRVLLMDEPLSNLDARLREEMRVEIRLLTRRLGLTTLYVTHDQTEALSLADQMMVMRLGEIVDRGAPEEVYRSPATRFSAEFVGHMIFVPGRVSEQRVVTSPLGAIACALPPGLREGDEVTLAMRPEDVIAEADDTGGTGDLRVQAEVIERLFLGDRTLFEVGVDGFTLSLRLAGTVPAQRGELLLLRFPAERWRVFAAAER